MRRKNAYTIMSTGRNESSDDLDLESLPSMDEMDEHDEEEVVAESDEEDTHQDKSVDFRVSDDEQTVEIEKTEQEEEEKEEEEEQEDDDQTVQKHEDEVRARRRDLARRRAVLDLMRSESAARVHRSLERKKQREKEAAVSAPGATAQDTDTKSSNGEDDASVGSNEKQSSEAYGGVPAAVADKTADVANLSGTKTQHTRVHEEVSEKVPQKTAASEEAKETEEKPAAQDADRSDDDEPKSLFEKHAWLKALVPILVILTILVILLVLFL